MSTTTPVQEPLRVPWLYLGGVFTLLIGFGISFFGGFLFNGGREAITPQNRLPSLALVGLGIAVFALGSFLLARTEQVRGPAMSIIAVTFLMMPLPALASYLINFLGNYLRRSASTALQVVLIGVGVFLLALAASWAWDIHQANLVRADFRAFTWTILADFGVASLLLAALPILAPDESAAEPGRLEPEQANE